MSMQVSVIIPTYNGAKKILNLLHSLEKQTFKEFEVIVVIDGSTDETKTILAEKQFSFPLKVIYQANKGRAGARNTGVKNASADWLVFVDDDMRLEADALQKHWNFQQITKNAILVGNAIEDWNTLQNDLQKYKAILSRMWVNSIIAKQPMPTDKLFLSSANCSMSKLLFEQLGGFDEKLIDAEDYDLGKRAIKQGISIYFDPEIIGWHDDFITCQSYIRRQQQYQKAHQRLKEFYPERYAYNPYVYKPARGIKRLIYRFFAGWFWVKIVDKYNFLMILPQKIRYKIYDIIITANAVYFPLNFQENKR